VCVCVCVAPPTCPPQAWELSDDEVDWYLGKVGYMYARWVASYSHRTVGKPYQLRKPTQLLYPLAPTVPTAHLLYPHCTNQPTSRGRRRRALCAYTYGAYGLWGAHTRTDGIRGLAAGAGDAMRYITHHVITTPHCTAVGAETVLSEGACGP
jgi:hypothetical protein